MTLCLRRPCTHLFAVGTVNSSGHLALTAGAFLEFELCTDILRVLFVVHGLIQGLESPVLQARLHVLLMQRFRILNNVKLVYWLAEGLV
jgi:hypothetical protein